MTRPLHLLLCTLIGFAALAAAHPAAADDTPQVPTWHALPAETFAAIHLPDAREFVDVLRQRTRFGQIALSDAQLQAYVQFVQELIGDDLEDMRLEMNRVGLELEDWTQVLNGPAGLGATLQSRADGAPLIVLLMWAEPGEDLAGRLVGAMEQAVEDAIAQGETVRRVDRDLAGTRVMHLSFPEQGYDVEPTFDDWPEDAEHWTPEKWDAHFERQQRAHDEAEWITVDRTNVMVARLGGRLIVALTPPQSADRTREFLAQDAAIDWDELTGVEATTAALARFLEQQQRDAAANRFDRRMLGVNGMEAALGGGVPLVDMFVDVPAVLELGRRYAEQDADGDIAELDRFFRAAGLERLGPMGLRMSLDGQSLRSGAFLAAPGPRRGLVALLDQPEQQPAPPAWVAADVRGYSHFSADLEKIYSQIEELIIEAFGDDAREGLKEMTQASQMFLQATPREILASVGTRHVALEFAPHLVEMEMPDFEAGFNPQTGEMATKVVEVPQQRMAYVWQIEDEAVWQRLFQMIGQFAPMAGGAMQPAEEQGFSGYRMEESAITLALFQGRGHLVVAVGADVAERVLSMISNPPAGDAALANSEVQARARQITRLRPNMAYQVGHAGRSIADARTMLPDLFNFMFAMGNEFDASFDLDRLDELVPSAEQLQASFGVYVSQMYTTDEGLAMEYLLEMPPAE